MGKTGYITARVEPKLKARAARVLATVGVTTTDAITMFLRQVVLRNGLPFEVRVPNAETRKAIEELETQAADRSSSGIRQRMTCSATLHPGGRSGQNRRYEAPRREHGLSQGPQARTEAWLRRYEARCGYREIATWRTVAGVEPGAPIEGRVERVLGECHVEPDWLLIYKVTDDEVRLARTGTHADLFEK